MAETGTIKMSIAMQMVTLAGLPMVLRDQLSIQMLTETQVMPVVRAMETLMVAAVQHVDLVMDSGVMGSITPVLLTPVLSVNCLVCPMIRPNNILELISRTTMTSRSKLQVTMSRSP